MRKVGLYLLAATLLGLTTLSVALSHSSESAEVRRGQYLVERVGMCIDCHSPRDEKGQFIRSRWLGGAAIEFKPIHPMPWADTAPPLAGLPGWTEEEAVTLLVSGVPPSGTPPRPPMPPYRMDRDDAKAVVAYLKSLPPVQATSGH